MPKEISDYLLHSATQGLLYRCPTDGHPIVAMRGDDKALCNCNTSNPSVPEEETHRTGTHIVRYLTPMSRAQYEAYAEQR